MSILQKMHTFTGKFDPVVKFADKKNLPPTFLYPMDYGQEAPSQRKRPTPMKASRALGGAYETPGERKASKYLNG